MKLKIVIPWHSFELLCTDIKIQANKPHFAVDATNQPDYRKKKLVYVFENADAAGDFYFGRDNGDSRAILLGRGDYSLIS